jgi:hypothetical protein
MADDKRLRRSQRLKDTRFSGISSAGEVGLRDTARGFEDKYPFYDTYGTPLSKGAIAAGEKKLREKINLLRDKEEVDKDAAKAAREAGAEERREARGMKNGGMVSASKRADGCAIRGKTRGKMV